MSYWCAKKYQTQALARLSEHLCLKRQAGRTLCHLGTSIDPAANYVETFQVPSFPRRRESSGARRKVAGSPPARRRRFNIFNCRININFKFPSIPRRWESNFVEISRPDENLDSRLRGNDGLLEVPKMKTAFKGNKSSLPKKSCAVCAKPMTWRKAWAKNWPDVKYCSEKCRRNKPSES